MMKREAALSLSETQRSSDSKNANSCTLSLRSWSQSVLVRTPNCGAISRDASGM